MGEVQRRAILDCLHQGGTMLEWGSGGSTIWFADHLPAGARLTTVEHDPDWFERVRSECGPRPNVRALLREATGSLGRNATEEEEDPALLNEYIHAVDGELFDVILVDGYARSACLHQALTLLKPGGTVFLHDAQRPWYDEAKRLYQEHGSIGSCADYPIPHLWFGGKGGLLPSGPADSLPVVVSYFTVNTPYEELAARLRRSCETLGLDHWITGRTPLGSWEANCSVKADVCLEALQTLSKPIVWVDADAVIRRRPQLLGHLTADFGIHKWDGWQFASGTVFFRNTALAVQLLKTWQERCHADPRVWDQVHLDLAWDQVSSQHPLETVWLPRSYCQIFDAPTEHAAPPVIEHFQASRAHKAATTIGTPMPTPRPSKALYTARLASRPLRHSLPGPDSQDFAAELQIEAALMQQPA